MRYVRRPALTGCTRGDTGRRATVIAAGFAVGIAHAAVAVQPSDAIVRGSCPVRTAAGHRGDVRAGVRLDTTVDTLFFVTNRDSSPGRGFVDRIAPGAAATYGRAVATVVEPWRDEYFDGMEHPLNYSLQYECISREEFRAEARARLARPGTWSHAGVVYVHGFWNSFDDAVGRAAEIKHRTRFTGAFVALSWPSADGDPITAYTHDTRVAGQSSPLLDRVIGDLMTADTTPRIHVIAHSMGSQLVAGVLEQREGHLPVRLASLNFLDPDIAADSFSQVVAPLASRAAVRTSLYVTEGDRALELSVLRKFLAQPIDAGSFFRRFHVGPRAGQVVGGLPTVVSDVVETIDISDVQAGEGGVSNGPLLRHSLHFDGTSLYDVLWGITRDMPPECRFHRGLLLQGPRPHVWKLVSTDRQYSQLPRGCQLRVDAEWRSRDTLRLRAGAPVESVVAWTRKALEAEGVPAAAIHQSAGGPPFRLWTDPAGTRGTRFGARIDSDGTGAVVSLVGDDNTSGTSDRDVASVQLSRVWFRVDRVARHISNNITRPAAARPRARSRS